MSKSYVSMLAELERRRDVLATELDGLNAAIEAIRALANGEIGSAPAEPPLLGRSTAAAPTVAMLSKPYERISVRWAVLWHLSEFARGPMRNSEIAEAILAGGYRSDAYSFPNAVSAVLSGMRTKGELDGTPDAGYYLTEKGKQMWSFIKQSERFRSIFSARGSEQLFASKQ